MTNNSLDTLLATVTVLQEAHRAQKEVIEKQAALIQEQASYINQRKERSSDSLTPEMMTRLNESWDQVLAEKDELTALRREVVALKNHLQRIEQCFDRYHHANEPATFEALHDAIKDHPIEYGGE